MSRGGPWTRHGHPVEGITIHGGTRPPVARCGGVGLCQECSLEALRLQAEARVAAHPSTVWIPFDFELVDGKKFRSFVEVVKMHDTVHNVPVILAEVDNGCHRTFAVPDIKAMVMVRL